MRLTSIKLRLFRNITALDWSPGPGLNLIHGENGQGKTNLLEAIHLALTGRSFRTRHETELLPWGARPDPRFEPTLAQVQLSRARGERTLRVMLDNHGKRAFADGQLVTRLTELLGEAALVTFTPDHAGLMKGAPGVRRRWLDWTLAQLSPVYLAALQRYARALRQMNTLLRSDPRGAGVRKELEAFIPGLAAAGAVLMHERTRQLATAAPEVATRWNVLGGAGELRLNYHPNLRALTTVEPASPLTETDLNQVFTQALREKLDEFRRRGVCTAGPHRDDFALWLDGHDLRVFGSQGQHRLGALTLQLESANWLHAAVGEPPILLLDDFGSELDPGRREKVLAGLHARGMQVLITATAPSDLGVPGASLEQLHIAAGRAE